MSQVKVKEAEDMEPILPGCVYIAPGDYHMEITGNGSQRVISLNQNPPLAAHRPAVDIMFDSVAQYGDDVVSVILTGMGSDGTGKMERILQMAVRERADGPRPERHRVQQRLPARGVIRWSCSEQSTLPNPISLG